MTKADTPEMEKLAGRLAEASVKHYLSPYEAVTWPESVDRDQWFFSPELISIHGTPAWDALDESRRKQLSFWEAVNFFSLNIHGEKPLIEGLARRLYRSRTETAVEAYLHHFLDEENKHMTWFGGFCRRYAGKIYPDKKVVFPREYAPGEEDLLFFAKVMIFEEIADSYNLRMSKDDRLDPLARRINLLHHQDEARHLAFGRRLVREIFEANAPRWSPEVVQGIREYLAGYLRATWKEYYNPQVYADAGIPGDPYDLMEAAWEHPAPALHRTGIGANALRVLAELGLVPEEKA